MTYLSLSLIPKKGNLKDVSLTYFFPSQRGGPKAFAVTSVFRAPGTSAWPVKLNPEVPVRRGHMFRRFKHF